MCYIGRLDFDAADHIFIGIHLDLPGNVTHSITIIILIMICVFSGQHRWVSKRKTLLPVSSQPWRDGKSC